MGELQLHNTLADSYELEWRPSGESILVSLQFRRHGRLSFIGLDGRLQLYAKVMTVSSTQTLATGTGLSVRGMV